MRFATASVLLGTLCLLEPGCADRDGVLEAGVSPLPTDGGTDDGVTEGGGMPDLGGHDGGEGSDEGGDGDGDGDGDGEGDGDGDGDGDSGGEPPALDPPAGETSGGSGGPQGAGVMVQTQQGESYRVITPQGGPPYEFLLVTSGVEGGAAMTNNLMGLGGQTGTSHMLRAVIDSNTYYGDEFVGQHVLDDVRARYDVDNDRTYLLSESAGTIGGMYVGLVQRQSYFAAYWANDINAGTDPVKTADELGFAPYGGVGPGGEIVGANDLVGRMEAAGYRLPPPAPYDGPGSNTHGDINQFIYALSWFSGKSRLD